MIDTEIRREGQDKSLKPPHLEAPDAESLSIYVLYGNTGKYGHKSEHKLIAHNVFKSIMFLINQHNFNLF